MTLRISWACSMGLSVLVMAVWKVRIVRSEVGGVDGADGAVDLVLVLWVVFALYVFSLIGVELHSDYLHCGYAFISRRQKEVRAVPDAMSTAEAVRRWVY